MDRRHLLSVAALAGMAAASPARAAPDKGETATEPATLNLPNVVLPVVVDGRVRNYVFVALKLHLAPDKMVDELRGKDAYFGDALVRTAHRTSLAVPDDWNRLSEAGITGAVMAIARVVAGPDVVARCEIVQQAPVRQVRGPAVRRS